MRGLGLARARANCPWLEELAGGYLREYAVITAERRGGLWGFTLQGKKTRQGAGFFVGFLTSKRTGLSLYPPECGVVAYVRPARSKLHQELVREPGSVFRRSYELLTKYTNRRPRFEFRENDWVALLRHQPLAAFPPDEEEKYARNFFMETLALLARSGLPAKLLVGN